MEGSTITGEEVFSNESVELDFFPFPSQLSSESGRRTGLEGLLVLLKHPTELMRSGISFGESGLSMA